MEELTDIPPTRFELAADARLLRQQLETQTLEEIIAKRVEEILDWQSHPDPVLRRFRRNSSLVFTAEELEISVRNEILRLLPFALSKKSSP